MVHSLLYHWSLLSGNMTAKAVSCISPYSTLCIHALTSRSSSGFWKFRFCSKLKSPLVKQSKNCYTRLPLMQSYLESNYKLKGRSSSRFNKINQLLSLTVFCYYSCWYNSEVKSLPFIHRICVQILSPIAPQSKHAFFFNEDKPIHI